MKESDPLFNPVTVTRKLALRNPIVLAPLWLVWDGRSDEYRAFDVRRAQGGVGLVIAPQSTPGDLDDWADPGLGAAFRPLIEGCHAAGAKIALQVNPGGNPTDELSAEQLTTIPERFARAAVGAGEAGFDALNIHGAHYSLVMRLLSPLQNHRTDGYGGPPENRWRVQLESVQAIRSNAGSLSAASRIPRSDSSTR